jgi:predicted Zn-dependent peptidase
MSLARPLVQLGFKDPDFDTDYAIKTAATRILLDALFGESSKFFEQNYSDGCIDGPFALEYAAGSFYGTAVCTNSAAEPRDAADLVLGEIARVRAGGLDEQRFEQIRRKHMGRFVRSFNSIESVAHGQLELAFRGLDVFDILQAYQKVTFEQLDTRFRRIFRDDNYSVSVIMPDR